MAASACHWDNEGFRMSRLVGPFDGQPLVASWLLYLWVLCLLKAVIFGQ